MNSLSKIIGVTMALSAAMSALPAQAGGVNWSVHIGVPVPLSSRPVYVRQERVYVEPQRVYVTQERYVTAEPAYVEPTVVYREPQGEYASETQEAGTTTVVTRTEYQQYPMVAIVPSLEFGSRGYWSHRSYHHEHRGWHR